MGFVMSVRLSVHPHGTAWLPLDGFSRNLVFVFRKSVEKIQFSLIPDKNNGYFTWRSLYTFVTISRLSSSNNEKYFRQTL